MTNTIETHPSVKAEIIKGKEIIAGQEEYVKICASALYGGEPCDTLHQAFSEIGLDPTEYHKDTLVATVQCMYRELRKAWLDIEVFEIKEARAVLEAKEGLKTAIKNTFEAELRHLGEQALEAE
ncbi:hypothetical protein MTBPR1_90176 [Candidatus Terasakiella magnetica]|uniref:Uncharacterized protein n=1 Tax=Candidatus Terasakiella magnetica TaxID=1867952 RepID=A0A1C3RMJ2_9PROT|nr:hypothetical protein [Candidatus Terasakiella magnetica]SCA58329.1 hypothetical protein MTBPR1_90176 [Candidatus Terasakiella magnetica]